MLPFAATAFSEGINWLTVVTGAFTFYITISFACVTWYVVLQARAGQLLRGPYSPAEFFVPPWFWQALALGIFSIFFFPLLFFVIVPMLAALVSGEKAALDQFGAGRFSVGRLAKWSLLFCGAIIFVEIPLADWSDNFFTVLLRQFNLSNPEQATVEAFKSYHRWSDIIFFLLQAVILSPILEEIFFRGFLFTFLKNHTSIPVAAVLSAGVFAFAHVNLGSVLPLWFLGVALALAYQNTGSLLLPICVHGLFNLMTGLSLLLDKGHS